MKKSTKRLLVVIACIAAVLIAVGVGLFVYIRMESRADSVTVEEAQGILDEAVESMYAESKRESSHYIGAETTVTVKEIDYGMNKNLLLTCDIKTLNVKDAVLDNTDELFDIPPVNPITGLPYNSTRIMQMVDKNLVACLEDAERLEHEATLEVFQMPDGSYSLYCDEDTMNLLFGGIEELEDEMTEMKTVTVKGEEIKLETNLRNGVLGCIDFDYDSSRPDNSIWLVRKWNAFVAEFRLNFIEDARWHYLTDGLWMTAKITFFAVLIGVVLGFLVAIIRCTHDKIGKLKILNAISKVYLTVIRGTPVLVQLMIIFFVIFMPLGINKVIAAILCFGLNSGAYVAEIVRGGIMSIDEGQFEAGRSLGFNYTKTMWYIILPQAFKSVLPALANEFIVLLKETSVASYIGINDLARGGDIIRGVTFSAFMPLIAVALIYLVIVMGLTKLVALLERRLRKSDRG